MNFKKIIIYQYDTLFHILNEIREKFNFDLVKADKKVLEEIKKNPDNDYLIISKTNENNFKNQLELNKTPIRINKLIELINLKFLKENFNIQSNVVIGFYKLNLNSRKISRNSKILDLTEREINLILFLNKATSAVSIDMLQKEVWEYGLELETHTVETHIYRLRKKIKARFNDENFIISSKEGYLIN